MTQEELKHNSRMLVKAGISNTEMATKEYWITADNELDYTASIASATTVTVSELPSNTIAMLIYVSVYRLNNYAGFFLKRKSTDIMTIDFRSTNPVTGGYGRVTQLIWLPTNGNQFYVAGLLSACDVFQIMGYKVKE